MLLNRDRTLGAVVAVCALATPHALSAAQLVIDGLALIWYRVVPAETWVGRIVIMALAAGGLVSLWGSIRFQKLRRRPYRWAGWYLLLSAMVLGSVEIRMGTKQFERGTSVRVYVRNSEMRLL